MLRNLLDTIVLKLHNAMQKVNIVQLEDNAQVKGLQLKGAKLRGKVKLSEGVKIIDGVNVMAESKLTIGRYTSLNGPNTDIFCKIHPVNIGSFVSIARAVSIQEYNHKTDFPSSYFLSINVFKTKVQKDIFSKGPITIGNDVWIGTQCVILSGANIGHGVIVAANSVVTGEIPPYAIAAGSPARIVGYRFPPEIVERLLKLCWWDWSIERIKQNEHFFSSTLTIEAFDHIQ